MLRFLVLAFLAAASATNVIVNGPCPFVKSVKNFEFPAYGGTWYEIARYPNPGEEDVRGKCTTAEYLIHGNHGKARNTHVVDGLKTYIDGDFDLVGPGKAMLTYTFDGFSKYSYVTVLDTDYSSYSIGYSCKYFKKDNKHQLFAWIMSRTPTFEGEAKAAVDRYFRENPRVLDTSKFVYNDHSEEACRTEVTRPILEFL